MSKNQGRVFESNFEDSIKESGYWFFRVRDVNPMAIKRPFAIPRNPYDVLIFDGEYLFALELKSTQGKSISHRGSNPQIKPHQTEALISASKHDNIIAGFILNFRSENKTYFVHIDDFIKYDLVSRGEAEDTYISKKNEMSIPLRICEEIGIGIESELKRVHYRYYVEKLLREIVDSK